MADEQKPGDPADRAADGAFGGVQSHRAGYGDDQLARLTEWLRAHPTATLASGEGALLLGEIDRLRRILAALREPSEAVELAATHEYWATLKVSPPIPRAIRAAVAAAEQEVDREA
jgi:hypothetical protein